MASRRFFSVLRNFRAPKAAGEAGKATPSFGATVAATSTVAVTGTILASAALRHFSTTGGPDDKSPRPFICHECNADFTLPITMKKHFEKEHPDISKHNFRCPKCSSFFKSKEDLKAHRSGSECPMKGFIKPEHLIATIQADEKTNEAKKAAEDEANRLKAEEKAKWMNHWSAEGDENKTDENEGEEAPAENDGEDCAGEGSKVKTDAEGETDGEVKVKTDGEADEAKD